jgi:tetratricopeptide (TPR) repeat protein
VFVIDNFDFIDGFSIEFFTKLIQRKSVWKNLKLIVIYEKKHPVFDYFGFDNKNAKFYVDIDITPITQIEFEQTIKNATDIGLSFTQKEKDNIYAKSNGVSEFIEQAISYAFECQISDRVFLLPKTFQDLIEARLELIKKNNKNAYDVLIIATILGDRIYPALLKEIFGGTKQNFEDIISYLTKSKFLEAPSENCYEFRSQFLWETIFQVVKQEPQFEDINIKIGKVLATFNLNTNPVMATIAQNLKENRMAFDIWTKITRLATYIGDINLYVIAQKQCLALLNEFNEDETLNIRYNISERLGKLLSEYDCEEAIEFLPDAISNAREANNEVKEIELLGYLATCCKNTGNNFGDIECVDNVLKKLPQSGYEIEKALIKSTKVDSLINVGNYGEVVNLIDNDILPILSAYMIKPRLDKTIPLNLIFDTKLKTMHRLAKALALQGDDRAFEILTKLFDLIEKHKIQDEEFITKVKLTLSLSNTMKGDFATSFEVLQGVVAQDSEEDFHNVENLNSNRCEIINEVSTIDVINRFMLKDYDHIQEILADCVRFANDSRDNCLKHLFKLFLAKVFYDRKQAKHAMDIYKEEIDWFATEKFATCALLGWYFIAQADLTMEKPKGAIDVATRALEIAQAPNINNFFLIVLLKMSLAESYMWLSDYETAKIQLESAIILAKKYSMNDLLSRLYLLYGKYYQELGSVQSKTQTEYIKGAVAMYDRAMTLVLSKTRNLSVKNDIEEQKNILKSFCSLNGFDID